MTLLLVGTGQMAGEYAKVLRALEIPTVAVGRCSERSARFAQATGLEVFSGGVETYLSVHPPPSHAIVATGVEELSNVSQLCLKRGVTQLLVEKPGALNLSALEGTEELRKACSASVFIGYNRRFLSSTQRCRRELERDGGVTSFRFDFTELVHCLKDQSRSTNLLAHWFEANSTHVVDLAFFLGGEPSRLQALAQGDLSWHPRGARFVGHGLSRLGAPFSYHADWLAPGRWSVELRSHHRRFLLCPLEELRIQEHSSFTEQVTAIDPIDLKFKAGLYLQVQAFISPDPSDDLMTLSQQVERMRGSYPVICPQRVMPLDERI